MLPADEPNPAGGAICRPGLRHYDSRHIPLDSAKAACYSLHSEGEEIVPSGRIKREDLEMGKVTLVILVLAIALGVYWFWWLDQGANGPISAEGALSFVGVPGLPGTQGPMKVNFTLQAMPNKLRLSGKTQGNAFSAIIRLDKREMYILDESKRTYSTEEFELVGMDQTKPPEETEETWPSEFKRTADWEYMGSGDGKRFCNKQTMTGLPKQLMDITKTAPGGSAEMLPLMQAMLKDVKADLWFTPETRLGRRYFSMLNKLARIREVGKAVDEKRPQFRYGNLDYFPIPMKAVIAMGPVRMEMEVKSLSRKRIPKDVFEVPSDYKKVAKQQMGQDFNPQMSGGATAPRSGQTFSPQPSRTIIAPRTRGTATTRTAPRRTTPTRPTG